MFDTIRAAWLRKKAARINGDRITTAEFLHFIGASDQEIKQWASALGGRFTRAYAKEHGAKPAKTAATVVKMGKKSVLVNAYGYRIQDVDLQVGVTIKAYPHLLGV